MTLSYIKYKLEAMKLKDIVELNIESIGMDGEGVAKVDGIVIFVDGALLGETIKAQVIEVKKNFARAKVIKVLSPSKERIEPLCPIFFRCGGCDLQHVNYEYQLKVKKSNIKNCIDRACKIDSQVNDVVYGKDRFGYRNKEQIPIRKVDGKAMAGFYKQGTHTFVPFEKSKDSTLGDCPLHNSQMQAFLDVIVSYINKEKVSTYDEKTNTGLIRHVVIRQIGSAFSICLVINGNSIPSSEKLVNQLKELSVPFNLYISINKKQTNVILGDELKCIYGNEKIEGEALGVKFSVNPYSFLQINDEIRDKIYTQVCDELEKEDNPVVLDLYSGIGILSNVMAKHSKKVIGIEIVKEAVEDANKLAVINGNANIENICDDVARALPNVVDKLKGEKTFVVIDPPRKGCDERVLQSIVDVKPDKIIYISCNPATLARDLVKLIDKYAIDSITPYDMFPQTKHVETVCLLTKK